MLSRIPPVRRSIPLVLAIFAVGAGVGALVVTLTQGSSAKTADVKPLSLSLTTVKSTSSRSSSAAGGPNGESSASKTPGPESEGAAATGKPLVPQAADASFGALAAHVEGQVGLAIAPLDEGPIQTFGSLRAGHAWSTMKVPVLVTLLAEDEHGGETLSSEQSNDARLALEESDNAAAEALFAQLERLHGGLVPASEALQETLHSAGDEGTAINTAPNDQGFTTWGQTIWSTSGEVRFYRTLADGCLLSSQNTEYVLQLMRSVVPSQRWGAGQAGYPTSLSLGFKGGWGPENGGGYLVRQTAIIGSGEHGYVESMIALPSGGTFEDGVNMINALASWARGHASLNVREPAPGCVG